MPNVSFIDLLSAMIIPCGDGDAGVEEWRVLHGIACETRNIVFQHSVHDCGITNVSLTVKGVAPQKGSEVEIFRLIGKGEDIPKLPASDSRGSEGGESSVEAGPKMEI